MLNNIKNIVLCIIALFLGGCFYIVFREDVIISQPFNSLLVVKYIRKFLLPFKNDFCSFYLPDFFWAFSLNQGLLAIYKPKFNNILFSGTVTFLCGSIWELLQALEIVSGTGDVIDVFMYFLASLASILINKKEKN